MRGRTCASDEPKRPKAMTQRAKKMLRIEAPGYCIDMKTPPTQSATMHRPETASQNDMRRRLALRSARARLSSSAGRATTSTSRSARRSAHAPWKK